MSLITEYNLSFSDIENCTAPRKPRSIKPQQYVQAADYERELLNKLPHIAGTKSTASKDGDVKDGNLTGGLGIKGVGKLQSDSQESFKYNNTERRKRKRKKIQKHCLKFSEDCYDNDDGIHDSSEPSLLPTIQSKQFTCENKANSVDKAGKTMTELTDYFRCYHGNYDKLPQRTLQRRSDPHERQKLKNSKKNANVLLAEAIEKDKNSQKQASKQLEQSVLRGRGMGHTCTHHYQ